MKHRPAYRPSRCHYSVSAGAGVPGLGLLVVTPGGERGRCSPDRKTGEWPAGTRHCQCVVAPDNKATAANEQWHGVPWIPGD